MLNGTLNWQATEDLATWIRANYRGKTSEYLNRTSMGTTTPSYTFVDLGANYQLTKEFRLMGESITCWISEWISKLTIKFWMVAVIWWVPATISNLLRT